MAKKHGILQRSRDDEEMRFFLRKIVALALLPADMISGAFCNLFANAKTEWQTLFDPLFVYFDNYWLQTRTPADFCVYRQLVRTNNAAESNNSRMSKYLTRRPSVMIFCVVICDIMRLASIEFISAQNGHEVRSRRVTYMADNDSLVYAWDFLGEGSLTTADFLSRAARAIHKFPRDEDVVLSDEEIDDAEEVSDRNTMDVENASDGSEDTMDSNPPSPEPSTVPAAVQSTPAVLASALFAPSSTLLIPTPKTPRDPNPVVTSAGHAPLVRQRQMPKVQHL